MEMRRIKHALLSILIFLFLVGCEHGIKESDLKIPYQTFNVDSTTTIYTFMMDTWGEEGYIMCKTSDTTYISKLDTDPIIPIIKSVSNDTIYLAYYCDKLYGEIDTTIIRKSIWEWAQKVGKYEIVQQRYYFLEGSGGLTIDTIDRIFRSRDSIIVYSGTQRIMSASINDVYTERRYNGYYLSVFRIDTAQLLQRWTSYYVLDGENILALHP
ncbi:MAG: hypothetical protein J5701_01435 [Bacteroidales bacterium]|nr:hypothetical protein [Bacteroidales bacterium]